MGVNCFKKRETSVDNCWRLNIYFVLQSQMLGLATFQQMFQDHQGTVWQSCRKFVTQKHAAITAAYAILTEDKGKKEAGGVLI